MLHPVRENFFINGFVRLGCLLVAEQSVSFPTLQTAQVRNAWRSPALRSAASIDWCCGTDHAHNADCTLAPDDGHEIGLVIARDLSAGSVSETGATDQIWAVAEPGSGIAAIGTGAAAGMARDGNNQALAEDLVNAQPHLIWTTGADGETEFRNERWHEFAGEISASEGGDAARWIAILHPAEQVMAWARWQHHLASGEPYEAEHRLRRHDGAYRWALARAVAVRGRDGGIVRWCGTFTDIQTLKANEIQLDFLACELTHRIGNIFAVVESMLMLSSRGQPEAREFAANACARIQALAQANAYIRPQRGTAPDDPVRASFHGLLATLLAPYRPGADAQLPPAIENGGIEISGPDVGIGPSAATLLALVIHELTTNAARHGALACPGGRLSVVTELNDGSLRLVWTETGGPALAGPPLRRGFGSTLTDRALHLPLGGKVERVWAASGLTITISLDCARLLH